MILCTGQCKETSCGMDSPRGMLKSVQILPTVLGRGCDKLKLCYVISCFLRYVAWGFEPDTCRHCVNLQIVSKTRVMPSLM
jgi:hypothetical protein